MNVNDFLSVAATIISGISLFLTYKNKIEQQELEKEIQQNEFNFSKKKVWYEKQNEILDTSVIKLMENFSKIQYIYLNHIKQKNTLEQGKNEILEEIDELDEDDLNHKLNITSKEKILDELDKALKDKVKQKMDILSQKIGEQSADLYENLLYLKSHKHYFSESIEQNINLVLRLTSKILKDIEGNQLEQEKFEGDLDSMKSYISKITDEIRGEFL